MFVRWRTRDHKDGRALIVQLVESKRVDGENRPRFLAHLGTCREPIDTLRHRLRFYERCDQVLDRLGLAPDDRAKIDAKLAVRIPRPTEAERALWQRERAILVAKFGRPDGFALPPQRDRTQVRTATRARRLLSTKSDFGHPSAAAAVHRTSCAGRRGAGSFSFTELIEEAASLVFIGRVPS
jgi:hypothetical protein